MWSVAIDSHDEELPFTICHPVRLPVVTEDRAWIHFRHRDEAQALADRMNDRECLQWIFYSRKGVDSHEATV